MSRAKQATFEFGKLFGGASFYLYKLGLGVSFVYWSCISAPSISVYIGPVSIWCSWTTKKP